MAGTLYVDDVALMAKTMDERYPLSPIRSVADAEFLFIDCCSDPAGETDEVWKILRSSKDVCRYAAARLESDTCGEQVDGVPGLTWMTLAVAAFVSTTREMMNSNLSTEIEITGLLGTFVDTRETRRERL